LWRGKVIAQTQNKLGCGCPDDEFWFRWRRAHEPRPRALEGVQPKSRIGGEITGRKGAHTQKPLGWLQAADLEEFFGFR
jgi:hypothetical protein